LVEPEVVATSPCRIKSPLHHFNACRPKWCSRQGLHLHWRRSRRRVSAVGLRERNRLSEERRLRAVRGLSTINSQPSTNNGASRRCCPGTISLQKKSTGCCKEA